MAVFDMDKVQHFKIIEGLISGKTRNDIAKAVGVSERTIYRTLQSKEFKEAVGGVYSELRALFLQAQNKALRFLIDLLNAEDIEGKKYACTLILKSGSITINE